MWRAGQGREVRGVFVMTHRLPCPEAPGPLEGYAARFDDLFGSLAQRRGVRGNLAGVLAPRDRDKTLTALAGAQPVGAAPQAAVQRGPRLLSGTRLGPGTGETPTH